MRGSKPMNMEEAEKEERKQGTGNERSAETSKSSEKAQFQEVVRGFMVEKELLEKRHEEEIERLKDTFSKERQNFLEGHHGQEAFGKSKTGSVERAQSSHSLSGYVEQSAHAQNNGHVSGGVYVTNSQQRGRMSEDNQQYAVYGSQVRHGYGQSSEIFSGGLSSAAVKLGSPTLAPYPSAQTHHPHQAPNVQSNSYLLNHRQLDGFSAEHAQRRGSSNDGLQQYVVQNGHSRSSVQDSISHQDLEIANTTVSRQQLGTSLHQGSSTKTGYYQVASNDGATTGISYAAKSVHHSDRDDCIIPGKAYEGVKTAGQSPPWIPEFYTYNRHPSKDNMADEISGEREVYSVGLELVNGPPVRVTNSNLASQIRPDLDYEDRLEQQREIMQESFREEKRQLRRTIEEEFARKFEAEKRNYEGSLQTLKKTYLELEYQRKESEVKIGHERDKLQMKYESERSEYERRIRKDSEELRSKSCMKYEKEMQQQREKYEGVIEKQKLDIESLTAQLGELNESLKREKDLIVEKFENEVKEIERRLRVQKEKTESELVVKLKSEISLLTSVNKSLREEIETKEREKQELEMMMKEERRNTELNYESQLSDIEAHFEADKQTYLAQYEEKIAILIQTEENGFEERLEVASEEVVLLRKENEELRKIVEKNYEVEQQVNNERDEILQGVIEEKEILRSQLQEVIFRRQATNYVADCETNDLKTANGQKEFVEEREASEKLQHELRFSQEERNRLVLKVEELLKEIETLKRRQQDVNFGEDEKRKLLAEITKLNEEIDKMFQDIEEKGRKEVSLKEKLGKLEEALDEKEKENTGLRMEKLENQTKLTFVERRNVDLQEDLSTLRRRKVELEEENSRLKREKSDSDGKLSVLKTTHEGLSQELQKFKQRVSQTEEEATVLKLEKLELQQQVRMLKMHQSNYQEVTKRLNNKSDSEGSGSILTCEDESGEGTERELARRVKKKSTLERQVSKLKRTKVEYEMGVERLRQDVETLEREALRQIEHNKAVSVEFVSTRKDFEHQMEDLKRKRKALEESVVEIRQEEMSIQSRILLMEKQKKELECSVDYLVEEERRMKQANEREIGRVSRTLEMKEEQLQKQVSLLESNKMKLQSEVESLEHDEAALRCNIRGLQKESEIISERISQMNDSARDVGRSKVSWSEEREKETGVSDVKDQIASLRRDRDNLIRNVNELERKQANLDISVSAAEENRLACEKELVALTQNKEDLESVVFSLRTEKSELESKVNELSEATVEHSTNAQRTEIELLRRELEMTRENCENIRVMYHGVQDGGRSKMEIVETELRMAEDNLMRLKRERLELEKTISTLLRQKTELEAEVAMIADAKSREERDATSLREERLELDAEIMRLRSQVSGVRRLLRTLEDTKVGAEREVESLETRKECVDRYVSGMEERLLIGHTSPVSWNYNPNKDYVISPRDDLEKQVLELREQKLSLKADLFRLRRKSGDGTDARGRSYVDEGSAGEHRVGFGRLGSPGDQSAQYVLSENENLHRDIEGLARQKSRLASEVTEMKVRKTDLDAQITNLEYWKLGLEQSGRLVQRRDEGGRNDVSGDTKVTFNEENSAKMGFVDYSMEQMQELRTRNSILEGKLGALERNLHEAKHEMESQTLEYQNQLNMVRNALQSSHSNPHQQQQLGLIVERLKSFIENSSSNTEDVYEDIKNEIRELNDKVEDNRLQMRVILENSVNVRQEESSSVGETMVKRNDVEEICDHLKDAEDGMEKYDSVVSKLQKENVDLMEVVSKLEARLSAAGKSHERLKRKKAILQQLFETAGEKTGEDLIQQSNLIFELDKDSPV